MGYGLVRGITTIAATHRTTQTGFSAQLDHLQWVTVTCPSALRCTPLGPSPAQTGCRTGLTGFGIMTCRQLARVSTRGYSQDSCIDDVEEIDGDSWVISKNGIILPQGSSKLRKQLLMMH